MRRDRNNAGKTTTATPKGITVASLLIRAVKSNAAKHKALRELSQRCEVSLTFMA